MADEREVLVEVKNLEVTYGSGRKAYKAVKNANFTIYKGETFGLVGESGSGKTTIGRAIMRILPTSGGEVLYKGQKINGKISHALDKQVIKEIQMIFQDPQSSLNERAKVGYIVGEGLMNVRPDLSAAERDEKVRQALLDVGLLPEFASRFPHEFSGGQRQRIGIARALVMEPEFIVADEPYFLPQATPETMRSFYRGYYPHWSDDVYERMLALFNLDPTAKVAGFSKGMQRQLGILLGFATGVKTMLLDESFDGLDLGKRNLLKRLLGQYAHELGASVILSSHNLRELEDAADHLGMIKGCRLTFDDSVAAVHEQYPGSSLEEIFLSEGGNVTEDIHGVFA